jgi:AraC family transcriptional regulator of adaptative response / methylphosphotriester-DNA alkyltransferase methyltransferase
MNERRCITMLTEEEKWKAALECDTSYDGRFYYGVKTTGIFCRPSCKSKSPKRENVEFFDTAEQARESGLRPCKRCRPDLLEFYPQRENAEKIKDVYDLYFSDHDRLKEELSKLGLSRNRILQLFQNQYEKTPAEYLNALRVASAKKLLADTSDNILPIALQSGFESLSAFYTQFRRVTGLSPNEYRECLTGKKAD